MWYILLALKSSFTDNSWQAILAKCVITLSHAKIYLVYTAWLLDQTGVSILVHAQIWEFKQLLLVISSLLDCKAQTPSVVTRMSWSLVVYVGGKLEPLHIEYKESLLLTTCGNVCFEFRGCLCWGSYLLCICSYREKLPGVHTILYRRLSFVKAHISDF